jgi:ubiquinone/menaquinone biosynthesis C-methylase UbiE
MSYSARAADDFWSRRCRESDELSAVLYYGVPATFNAAYSNWELERLMRVLGDVSGKRVMDVACGNGRVTLPLARAGASVTSVDNAQGMLDRCRERVAAEGLEDRVTFVHSSASELTLDDDQYDFAVCLGLLEHLPPDMQEKVVDHVHRTTAPGGVMVFTASNTDSALLRLWQRDSQNRNQQDPELDGFFINMVDRAWLEDRLHKKGAVTRIIGSNACLAFGLYIFRGSEHGDVGADVWDRLFATCGELDTMIGHKGGADSLLSEIYLLEARKIAS